MPVSRDRVAPARAYLEAAGTFSAASQVMSDYRPEAAAALGDDRWLALSDAHARLYRDGDWTRGRAIRQADERNYINDTDLARMLSHIELLGLPRGQVKTLTRDGQQVELNGSGHPAVMRAWLIQALTGRRAPPGDHPAGQRGSCGHRRGHREQEQPGGQRPVTPDLLQVQSVEEQEPAERAHRAHRGHGRAGKRQAAEEPEVDQRLPAAGLIAEEDGQRGHRDGEEGHDPRRSPAVGRAFDDRVGQRPQAGPVVMRARTITAAPQAAMIHQPGRVAAANPDGNGRRRFAVSTDPMTATPST